MVIVIEIVIAMVIVIITTIVIISGGYAMEWSKQTGVFLWDLCSTCAARSCLGVPIPPNPADSEHYIVSYFSQTPNSKFLWLPFSA